MPLTLGWCHLKFWYNILFSCHSLQFEVFSVSPRIVFCGDSTLEGTKGIFMYSVRTWILKSKWAGKAGGFLAGAQQFFCSGFQEPHLAALLVWRDVWRTVWACLWELFNPSRQQALFNKFLQQNSSYLNIGFLFFYWGCLETSEIGVYECEMLFLCYLGCDAESS